MKAARHWRADLLLAALFALLLIGATPASFQEIEESLTCQCGCGLTVHSCNHLQCGSALPLRDEIRGQLNEGKDIQAILAHFSDKYGEKILSAPTTNGFNLVAWVMPFAILAIGGVVVALTVTRWAGRRAGPPPVATAPRALSPHAQVLEKELKDFDA